MFDEKEGRLDYPLNGDGDDAPVYLVDREFRMSEAQWPT